MALKKVYLDQYDKRQYDEFEYIFENQDGDDESVYYDGGVIVKIRTSCESAPIFVKDIDNLITALQLAKSQAIELNPELAK